MSGFQTSLKTSAAVVQVGGMGDVVTALARAVQDEGHLVTCLVPKYDCLNYDEVGVCTTAPQQLPSVSACSCAICRWWPSAACMLAPAACSVAALVY